MYIFFNKSFENISTDLKYTKNYLPPKSTRSISGETKKQRHISYLCFIFSVYAKKLPRFGRGIF